MRILALDWGEVRVGAAVSDPEGMIAFPLDKFIESKKAINEIKKIIDELKIEKIIVGFPKNLSGEKSGSSEKVESFAADLKEIVETPIEFVDERFTSFEAGKKLTDQGLNQKEQRFVKDNIAAQIMLQQYLDTKNN